MGGGGSFFFLAGDMCVSVCVCVCVCVCRVLQSVINNKPRHDMRVPKMVAIFLFFWVPGVLLVSLVRSAELTNTQGLRHFV